MAAGALRLLRGVQSAGVVTGGGLAYLACEKAVADAAATCADRDEAVGIETVLRALSAPFRQLAANAGVRSPAGTLHRARESGPDIGIDVTTGELADLRALGVRDPAPVAAGALQAAGEVAGLLLSARVICHD
jgi:chaperonin GroEL